LDKLASPRLRFAHPRLHDCCSETDVAILSTSVPVEEDDIVALEFR
jgi:hypothetical protein